MKSIFKQWTWVRKTSKESQTFFISENLLTDDRLNFFYPLTGWIFLTVWHEWNWPNCRCPSQIISKRKWKHDPAFTFWSLSIFLSATFIWSVLPRRLLSINLKIATIQLYNYLHFRKPNQPNRNLCSRFENQSQLSNIHIKKPHKAVTLLN